MLHVGVVNRVLKYYFILGVVDMTSVGRWAELDPAGRDTYWHVRPRHAEHVFRQLFRAQLRDPASTAFTVVVPMVTYREWRKYLRHFRRQQRFTQHVPGLGAVTHWVLRSQPGDALRGRVERTPDEAGWLAALAKGEDGDPVVAEGTQEEEC